MAEDRRRDALLQIGLAIGSAVETDDLLRLVMGHVTQLLSAERSTLYMVDRRRGEIWSKVLQGDGMREIRLPLGHGVAGDVVATGEPANIHDAYQDPRFLPEFDKASGFRTRSILCTPVWGNGGEVLGAVQVLNRVDGHPFDDDDEQALLAVSAQLSVAMENARLFAAERRKVRELDLLYSVEREMGQAADDAALLDVAISRATELTGADAAAALILDEEKSELFFKSVLGGAGAAIVSTRVPLSAGIAGQVARDGIPRIVHDVERESPVAREVAQRFGYRSRSLCAAPIQAEGRILGVLELLNKRDGDFGEDDVKLLTMLGRQAGRALRLTRDRAARERDERLRLLGQTVASVMHDLRSPLTVVQSYAVAWRRARMPLVHRHGPRHSRGSARPALPALRQRGKGGRHRARAGHRQAGDRGARRRGSLRERARQGNNVHALAAGLIKDRAPATGTSSPRFEKAATARRTRAILLAWAIRAGRAILQIPCARHSRSPATRRAARGGR